ncbi:MAG TPA: flagellin [Acidobacteriaceae bacterium]
MQINPNITPTILSDMNQSQSALNTALQQVATGLSVNVPSDNPTASAAMVQNTIDTGNVDQYQQNVNTVLSTVQSASSVLSNVVTALTRAVSLGTEGANGTNSAANMQAIAAQVQGVFSSVVSLANSSVGGTFLFGGNGTTAPYTADSSASTGYTYTGTNDVSSVAVGNSLSVQVNLPGSQVFSSSSNNVLGSLNALVTALQGGNSSAISTATAAVNSSIGFVSQQQAFYGNAENQLNSQETSLQQDTVTLASQATNLVGINLATAATNLTQAETENSAAMAAVAKVMPNTLLNYLSPPA